MAKASMKSAETGESIAGYFRPILEGNHDLLRDRGNARLFEMWLRDHPDEKKVPTRVVNGLANLKSVLRKKFKIKVRKKGKRAAAGEAAPAGAAPVAAVKLPRASRHTLEALEERIDDCMSMARAMDAEHLAPVIKMLRAARNEVVRMSGGG
jgi:hypothetical protein